MTAIQLKQEISKELENVPEKILSDILDLIKEFKSDNSSNSSLVGNLKKILSEDSDLLHKLAQ